MDELARCSQEKWKALAGANALFSRPLFDPDAESARLNILSRLEN